MVVTLAARQYALESLRPLFWNVRLCTNADQFGGKGFIVMVLNGFAGELRLHELGLVDADVVDLAALKSANLIARDIRTVKVYVSGTLDKAVTVKGIKVSKGARAAIEAAGGRIEE